MVTATLTIFWHLLRHFRTCNDRSGDGLKDALDYCDGGPGCRLTIARPERSASRSDRPDERAGEHGLRVEPAARFVRGDKVVTVLRWSGPRRSGFTITSAVPPTLALESTSGDALQVSTDGGRSWTVLTDPDRLPQGVTHLRWPAGQGAGTLTYRAVVR
jgi:hypothetical protein